MTWSGERPSFTGRRGRSGTGRRRSGTREWRGRTRVGWVASTARHYSYYPFLNVGHFRLHGVVDEGFQEVLAGYYREGLERCLKEAQTNPYRVGVPFIWCSNNLVVALVTQCGFYERMTGDIRYRELGARNRDWLLGRNPWGYTMFTSVGQVYPTDVHLQTTKLTGAAWWGDWWMVRSSARRS